MRALRRSALVQVFRNANAVERCGVERWEGRGEDGDHLGSVNAQHADVDRVSD